MVILTALFDEFDETARFLGASEALSGTMGLRSDGATDDLLHSSVARAREVLGANAYAAAEVAGRALSYEETIAAAQAWLGRHA
jgi:hypothetical protein